MGTTSRLSGRENLRQRRRGNRGRSSDIRFKNWIYLILAGHASKSPHRPVRRSFSEDLRPWRAAPYHCEGD
ncbi:hypothetical protein D1BOALGB6SA_288 [Olavius sp. associated proteobacterium Delta 1]|nr:hypothetical protein D1BOALGB6SA_288 [Olavius sp. associated proteobacterium Delta 1]